MRLFLPVIGRHAIMVAEPNGALRVWCPPEAPVFAAGKGQVRIEDDHRLTLRLLEPAMVVTYEGVAAQDGLLNGSLVGPGAVLGRAAPGSEGILVRVEAPGRLNLTAYSLFQGGRDPVAAPLVERDEPVARGSTRAAGSDGGDPTADIDDAEPVPLGGPNSSGGDEASGPAETGPPAEGPPHDPLQPASSPVGEPAGGEPSAPAEPGRPAVPVPEPVATGASGSPPLAPAPPSPTAPASPDWASGRIVPGAEPAGSRPADSSPPPESVGDDAENDDDAAHRLAARSPRPPRRRRRKEE